MKPYRIAVPLREEKETYFIKKRYSRFLKRHHCMPVWMSKDNVGLLKICDAIMFAGGKDIHPSFYHEKKERKTEADIAFDKFEFRLIQKALTMDLPIFGICRGIQLLNVYFKGTLHQDIPFHMHTRHNVKNLFPFVSEIKEASTNSYHHQAIQELGEGFLPFLISSDGVIEGIMHTKKKIIALEYHPEIDDPFSIFSYFIRSYLCKKGKH